MVTTVFLCQNSSDSIFCGVYDAWMSCLGHENVRLQLAQSGNLELFCEYKTVERTDEKRDKVIHAIRTQISEEAWECVFYAALSQNLDKADWIYRFLVHGFRYGRRTLDMVKIPAVYEIFQMHRNIWNENHHLLGFLRFSKNQQGILFGRIAPKNDVLVLLAPHFAERLSGENWIIYDDNRKKAVVQQANSSWVIVEVNSQEWENRLAQATDEEEFEDLWKAFHESISIKERENSNCQKNMLPLRFRPYMVEFKCPVGSVLQLKK